MARIEEHLRRWTDSGILPGEIADRIRAFERDAADPESDAGAPPTATEQSRPGALESLLYLGLVVLVVGLIALIGQRWGDLESWARLAVVVTPTLLIFGVGALLLTSLQPELRRASQAAWFVTVGLFAGSLGVLLDEYDLGFGHNDGSEALLFVASGTFLVAIALWVINPSHLQVIAIALAGLFLGQAVGAWSDDFSQALAGLTILVIGIAGVALAEIDWLTPRTSAAIFFALLTIIGPYEAGVGDGNIGFEMVAALAAAATIAYGVLRASFGLVLVGVGGAFVVLVTFIFEHFQDRIGAPTALIVSGGILVAAVLLLAFYRNESRTKAPA